VVQSSIVRSGGEEEGGKKTTLLSQEIRGEGKELIIPILKEKATVLNASKKKKKGENFFRIHY